ncbi:MAG TPA: hypothetical protein VEC01_08025 [Noviherbaspirillum sp.]|uniref:hypothetical protein n=1 Tax=Noviherbaspirillum sp. TaxID=1926288 RepID=UPI002D606589|nr:hypothetical protein [Noviherbaspirillum sp.]HYD95257.1 hypothetical protein [Noviherbaspirillum sp.]
MKTNYHFNDMDGPQAPWLDELMQLVARFSDLNVAPDLSNMVLADLWAVYLSLRRRAETLRTE